MNGFPMSNEEDGEHVTVINSDSELIHDDVDGLDGLDGPDGLEVKNRAWEIGDSHI